MPFLIEDLFNGNLEYLTETDDNAIILMGDLLEMASRRNASDIFEQTISPQRQIDDMIDILDPLKDDILCMVEGTHERRPYKDYGITATYIMAKQLGVKYVYPGANIFISIGDYGKTQNYTIYATHGKTSAWTSSGKMRACERLSQAREANIYLHAHVHDLDVYTGIKYKPDWKNRKMKCHKQYFVLTGHFLEYDGSYAEAFTYPPGKPGVAKIKLFKDRWDIHVSV